jgi:hypothetical protein
MTCRDVINFSTQYGLICLGLLSGGYCELRRLVLIADDSLLRYTIWSNMSRIAFW